MVSRLVVVLLACLLIPLPAIARAELDVSHERLDFEEVGGTADGVPAPGDRLHLVETFRSATSLAAGTSELITTTPGVTVDDGTSPVPAVVAGGIGRNSDPFSVVLPATGLDCGIRLMFAMRVFANNDSGAFPITIPTGAAGPVKVFGDDPARALADAAVVDGAVVPGQTEVVINVPEADSGLIKSLNLRIPRIDHPRIGDLKLELIAPDATKIVLADGRGGTGANMVNTVFSDGGGELGKATAPFTGTYAPEETLRILEGRRLNGPWTLRITDTAVGETGTLQSWRLDSRRAFCAGIPRARLAMTSGGAAVTQVQPGATVDFDASGSTDTNGTIESYEFDLDGRTAPGDEDRFEIGPTSDPTHAFTYPVAATVPIAVRVTDDAGLTDTEEVDLPVTTAPVAALSASTLTPTSGQEVTFDAIASTDPDGSIARFEFDLDGNGTFETDRQTSPTAKTTFAKPGTRTIRVRVTDNRGATDTEQVVVTVGNRAPVAAATVSSPIYVGQTATLDATASSDPDGTVKRYQWDLSGDGVADTDMADEPVLEHVFAAGGARTVTLFVTDDQDAVDTETFPIVVRHAPTVSLVATPDPVSPRRPLTVVATAADLDTSASALTYQWDLDGDGDFDEEPPGTLSQRVLMFPSGGLRKVGVRVADPEGGAATHVVQVMVRNLLPTARLTAAPPTVLVGKPIVLDARGSTDPDGDVMTYRWDLNGDGEFELDTGTTGTAVATYAAPGTARPAVRVTDDDQATSIKAIAVSVTSPPAPPKPVVVDTGGGTPPPAPSDPAITSAVAPPLAPLAPAGGTRAAPDAGPPGYTATLQGAAVQRKKVALAKGIPLTCTAVAAGRCIVEAMLSARDARRLGLTRSKSSRPVSVGRVTALLVAGKPARMTLRLKPSARRKLARAGRVRLVVAGIARDWTGRQAELSRVVQLRP